VGEEWAAPIQKSAFRPYNLRPIWPLIEMVGQMREDDKQYRESTRAWRGEGVSTHTPSFAGEIIAACATGQQVDPTLRRFGDDGFDLPDGTDVKTVVGYWPPILKHPVDSGRWAPLYALVYLDRNAVGRYIGRVTADELRAGEIRNFGHGDNHTLDMAAVVFEFDLATA
jgi:hypothetical protein